MLEGMSEKRFRRRAKAPFAKPFEKVVVAAMVGHETWTVCDREADVAVGGQLRSLRRAGTPVSNRAGMQDSVTIPGQPVGIVGGNLTVLWC